MHPGPANSSTEVLRLVIFRPDRPIPFGHGNFHASEKQKLRNSFLKKPPGGPIRSTFKAIHVCNAINLDRSALEPEVLPAVVDGQLSSQQHECPSRGVFRQEQRYIGHQTSVRSICSPHLRGVALKGVSL